jgi:hypothetical protein
MRRRISGASGALSIDRANHPNLDLRPSYFDRPADNVSGTAVYDCDPPIGDFFPKSWKALENREGREFSNARAFANPSPATLRCHALGVVRGDQPDSPGKRNLALIGLQRAADRRGNRGTRFPAVVLQGAACGSECHRGFEGLFDSASTGNVESEIARLKSN